MSSDEKRFSYDPIADAYAGEVDRAPYNAFYERPAMFRLMPAIAGRRILDAGCGGGWYSEQMLERGAAVDAVDESAAMVEHARARLANQLAGAAQERLTIQQANLEVPLPFGDARFDGIVSPLVLHYIADWRPTLGEFRRVLKPGGWLLFSTHHPAAEMVRFAPQNYFQVEHIVDTWSWLGQVEFYRRPLSEISAALFDTGFLAERLAEPMPTEEFRAARPQSYAQLMKQPEFLIVLARTRAH